MNLVSKTQSGSRVDILKYINFKIILSMGEGQSRISQHFRGTGCEILSHAI